MPQFPLPNGEGEQLHFTESLSRVSGITEGLGVARNTWKLESQISAHSEMLLHSVNQQ